MENAITYLLHMLGCIAELVIAKNFDVYFSVCSRLHDVAENACTGMLWVIKNVWVVVGSKPKCLLGISSGCNRKQRKCCCHHTNFCHPQDPPWLV